jgi:hypothetical protein
MELSGANLVLLLKVDDWVDALPKATFEPDKKAWNSNI